MIEPLRCCAAHVVKIGKPPSMAIRCPSCADYRGYLEHSNLLMVEHPAFVGPLLSYKAQKAQRKENHHV